MTPADPDPTLLGLRVDTEGDAGGSRMLRVRLPRKRALGVMFLSLAAALLATSALALRDTDYMLYVVGATITAFICLPVGHHMVFTRHCVVVTGSELRLELLPRREVLLTMPRQSIRRLSVVRTERGEQRKVVRFELLATDVNGDHRLLVTADERVAVRVEQLIESVRPSAT